MIRACAWCGAELGFRCPHCCKDLLPVDIVRSGPRGRLAHYAGYLCPRTDPPRVFEITQHTPATHGICPQCAALRDPERDQFVRIRRRQIPGVSAATRALIAGEILTNAEKRGPIGVPRSATPLPPTPHTRASPKTTVSNDLPTNPPLVSSLRDNDTARVRRSGILPLRPVLRKKKGSHGLPE